MVGVRGVVVLEGAAVVVVVELVALVGLTEGGGAVPVELSVVSLVVGTTAVDGIVGTGGGAVEALWVVGWTVVGGFVCSSAAEQVTLTHLSSSAKVLLKQPGVELVEQLAHRQSLSVPQSKQSE